MTVFRWLGFRRSLPDDITLQKDRVISPPFEGAGYVRGLTKGREFGTRELKIVLRRKTH